VIDSLSNSAKNVFKTMQSTKEWVTKDSSKKREFSDTSSVHLEDDDDDEEDLDEEGDEGNNTFVK
jgi:hypothetical protein